jgi:hypothetical protein
LLEGLETAAPEPVLIEEQPALSPEPPHEPYEADTMIFRPVEMPEPVWKDETVPALPAPETTGPTAWQSPLEAEAPAASPEAPVEQPLELPPTAPSVTATRLDSFSLDDAAAGQVHFASGLEGAREEGAYSALAEEVPVPEFAHHESAPETVLSEIGPPETAGEAALAEVVPPEVVPEAVGAQVAPAAATTEVAYPEVAPPEAVAEAAFAEVAPPEVVPEAVGAQVAPAEVATDVAYPEVVPPEAAAEAAPLEPASEVATPPPVFDWDLFRTIIRKVVVKMSPPVLAAEAVEEIAGRLADEIATEITSGPSQPQA